ncbi:MAG TPA: hypothetical protein VHT51_15860 [Micropepsaceae bacterium]|jgi:neutral trehalase|nr:hypothetical protein [Micropepsaceae bacterium]
MTPEVHVPPNGNERLTTAELARGSMPANGELQNKQEKPTSLLPDEECNRLRHQWDDIQTSFVDEPRRAVEQADNLVAISMKRVAEMFADERAKLESQWDRSGNVSTEDLRLALQRYRSFFQRLLTI